jgi:diguanylate cyclase (GGDEF)-like protein
VKVLIAEDDPVSRRMLQALLVKWGYHVMVAAEGEEAWQVLQGNEAPRLVILDWMMPGRDGIDICRSLRQRKGRAYIYILLLTARGQKQDIVEGLEAGADDYLTKPFDPYELRARVRAGQRIVELQERLLQAREALRDQASRDPLTDLWNHGTILAILRKELARALSLHIPFAVAMADMDGFKAINDTYGHRAGDAVLRETSRRLRRAMRTCDSLGRYGGDEFLAVVPGCDPAGAARFGECFRARIDRKAVETPEGLIPVTLSLGVVALESLEGVNSEALVRVADTALYRAKIAGRNRVVMATSQDVKKELVKRLQECEPQDPGEPLRDLPTSPLPVSDAAGEPAV